MKRIPDDYNGEHFDISTVIYGQIQAHLQAHGWEIPHHELDRFVEKTLWRFVKRNAVPFEK